MLRRLLLLVLLLPGSPARADPAVWVVHGPHATVYLFGSLHVLRPGTKWQGAALHQAFSSASECWFEVNQRDDDIEKIKALVARIGFDPSQKLSELLTLDENTRLLSLLGQHAGTTKRGLGWMRPWLAAWTLANAIIAEAGYEETLGADNVLQDEARTAGKVVAGLESTESHLHILADLPTDVAVRELDSTLEGAAKAPEMLKDLVEHWQAGNIETATFAAAEWLSDAPELREAMLTKRNVSFANAIEDFLLGDRTILVTVGAGHFAGPGNVRELLEARGIKINRVSD